MNITGKFRTGLRKFLFPKSNESDSLKNRHLIHRVISNKHSGKPADDELADIWLSEYPLTAFGLGEFRRYQDQDGVWHLLNRDSVKREIAEIMTIEKENGIRPTKSRLESVYEWVRLNVLAENDIWDNQPDYILFNNGVLHIPTQILYPHSPEYYFTTGLDYDYDHAATCPNFMKVMQRLNPEVRDFLQEFAGYSLTSDTKHEIALWLYGPPGGGKSTFLIGLQTLLGPRVGNLGLDNISRSNFGLTNLPGKFLLIATENPGGSFAATYVINSIISGEPLEINLKFRDPITIISRAKIAWAMNDLPRIKDAGNGLFRRVKIVQFPALPESERDPEVKEAIKDEGPGILNWALEGLIRLKKRGQFEIPDTVLEATKEFQESNDVPANFVSEMCLVGSEYRVQSKVLYQAYSQWCYANGHSPESSTAIAQDWKRLGFVKHMIQGYPWWFGVQIKH